MSACVRYLGEQAMPLGQVVFFRAAFAIVPVLLIYAWRRELAAVVRTARPFGHLGRGMISVVRHVPQFRGAGAAAARRRDRDLVRVAADHRGARRARSSRSACASIAGRRSRVGFVGVIVMLWPHLDSRAIRGRRLRDRAATLGALCALLGAFTNAGSVVQTRRLTDTETTSSIVFYFSLFCAIAGLSTLPFGWIVPSGRSLRRWSRPACSAGSPTSC